MSALSPKRVLFSFAAAVLLGGHPAARAADALPADARETFEWLAGLGFPDVAQARWAEVHTGRWAYFSAGPAAYPPVRAMLTSEEGDKFNSLDLAWESNSFTKSPPDIESYKRVGFELRSLEADARAILDAGHKRLAAKDSFMTGLAWMGGYRLPQRSCVAVLAFFCHRQGHTALAAELYSVARQMPDVQRKPAPAPDVRTGLERDLGSLAFQRALEQLGGLRHIRSLGSMASGNPAIASRKEVLAIFRRMTELYSHSDELPRANQIVSMLERMVAEDEAHPAVSDEGISGLPVEQQVREWIFRLRDQTGFEPSPGWHLDIFGDAGLVQGTSPAHRLVEIGYPAVPQLLAALEDQRFCRAVRTLEDGIPYEPLTVAYCAWEVLERISCDQIRLSREYFTAPKDQRVALQRAAVEKWWKVFQQKGEKQWLFDALAAGEKHPLLLARRLGEKWPEALADALLLGVTRLNDTDAYQLYLRLLGTTQDPRATAFLLKEVDNDTLPAVVRKTAAEVLKQRNP